MGLLNAATSSLHGAVDQAAEAAAPAAQWLEEQGEAASAGGVKLLDGVCKYVSSHPLQSVGMALVAGYLASRLTR
jgi:ElaB/YqjD/DUF883 family membrane-anchored ribosome-binding protein